MVTSPSPFVRFRRRNFPAAKPRMIFDDFCGHRKDLIIFTFDSLAITSLPNHSLSSLLLSLLHTSTQSCLNVLTKEKSPSSLVSPARMDLIWLNSCCPKDTRYVSTDIFLICGTICWLFGVVLEPQVRGRRRCDLFRSEVDEVHFSSGFLALSIDSV